MRFSIYNYNKLNLKYDENINTRYPWNILILRILTISNLHFFYTPIMYCCKKGFTENMKEYNTLRKISHKHNDMLECYRL